MLMDWGSGFGKWEVRSSYIPFLPVNYLSDLSCPEPIVLWKDSPEKTAGTLFGYPANSAEKWGRDIGRNAIKVIN